MPEFTHHAVGVKLRQDGLFKVGDHYRANTLQLRVAVWDIVMLAT